MALIDPDVDTIAEPVPTLDDLFRVIYTGGWCALLAWAIKETDPDRFTVIESPDASYHVAVIDHDGTVWDIDGPSTPDAWEARWGPLVRVPDLPDRRAHAIAATEGADWGPANVYAWRVTRGLAAQLTAGRVDRFLRGVAVKILTDTQL